MPTAMMLHQNGNTINAGSILYIPGVAPENVTCQSFSDDTYALPHSLPIVLGSSAKKYGKNITDKATAGSVFIFPPSSRMVETPAGATNRPYDIYKITINLPNLMNSSMFRPQFYWVPRPYSIGYAGLSTMPPLTGIWNGIWSMDSNSTDAEYGLFEQNTYSRILSSTKTNEQSRIYGDGLKFSIVNVNNDNIYCDIGPFCFDNLYAVQMTATGDRFMVSDFECRDYYTDEIIYREEYPLAGIRLSDSIFADAGVSKNRPVYIRIHSTSSGTITYDGLRFNARPVQGG